MMIKTMHRKFNKAIFFMMVIALVLIFAMYFVSVYTRDSYYINLSPSLPYGLYKRSAPVNLKRGDIVIFIPPDYLKTFIYKRHWLPDGWPLMKQIGAMAGDTYCINKDQQFLINGKFVGPVYKVDNQGLPLPKIEGCRTVETGTILPVATHVLNSFDGRYIGTIPLNIIKGKAVPLYNF
jgi:conjugative transfer signal peptidase TraF